MLSLPRLLLFLFASVLLCLPSVCPLSAQCTPYPREHWEESSPEAMGLHREALDELAAYMEGDGCVIRHGRMVYQWGDPARRGDIASACKPWISFFLFLALEEGLLECLDTPAHQYKPCLAEINAELDHKDRGILMRHFATQTSCYGVKEAPGTAFDYNDWQTALFVEILFQKIYNAPPDGYDGHILLPRLTERLQCEDSPTFYAFGTQDRPGRLAVSPRDFCRFGYLFLRGGRWHSGRILAEEHIRQLTTQPLPAALPRTMAQEAELCEGARSHGSQRIPDDQCDHGGSYSWMWWVNGVDREGRRYWRDAPDDAFAALGHKNGMRGMAVIPSLDIVFSWNNTRLDTLPESSDALNAAFRYLCSAVKG